jgi:hypothetical protein
MPALSRATGIAAVALVAAVGAGGLIYLNAPGGPGGSTTPPATKAPTAAPTPPPTVAPTPRATIVIPDWTPYTSAVYDFTMKYPSTWSVFAAATRALQPGESAFDTEGVADIFSSPDGKDDIGMWVWRAPASAGADLGSWEGLEAAYIDLCGDCTVASPSTKLCLGEPECQPALLVGGAPVGVFGDPATNTVTIFSMGREDDWPGTAKYGGTVALLKAILAQVDVRVPQPGETVHPGRQLP